MEGVVEIPHCASYRGLCSEDRGWEGGGAGKELSRRRYEEERWQLGGSILREKSREWFSEEHGLGHWVEEEGEGELGKML